MFGALALIAGVVAFFMFPMFRKAVVIITVVLVLGIFGYIENQKEQTEAAKRLVRVDQLKFSNMNLGPESYGSSYKMTGRIKNTSPYSIFEVKARIQVLDCDENSHCEVVGDEEQNMAPLIPPGEVRDVDTSIYFGSETQVHGRIQWNYTVTEIQARA